MKSLMGIGIVLLIVLGGCGTVAVTLQPDPIVYANEDAVVVYDEYYYDDVVIVDDYYYDDYYYDDVVYVDEIYYW